MNLLEYEFPILKTKEGNTEERHRDLISKVAVVFGNTGDENNRFRVF